MIPRAHIVDWARNVGWQTDDQVEQDLLLSRLIVEIADDPLLGNELAFRGGTCLHKLHTAMPARYSEDLDYVRRNAGGIADLTRAVSAIGERLGMQVRTRITRYPKIYLRAPFESGDATMRIKIEINTLERTPASPLIKLPFEVSSPWFSRTTEVQTFSLAELMATKLRALFQRAKGRDLLTFGWRSHGWRSVRQSWPSGSSRTDLPNTPPGAPS
jgi:predicted nucleotidyltransferase component of viral defense system